MKKLRSAAILSSIAVGCAHADSFNWAGWYVGGDIGQSEFRGNWTNKQAYDPFGAPLESTMSGAIADSSASMKSDEMVGGISGGYNWVLSSRWVVGLEGKWVVADQGKKINYIPGLDPAPDPDPTHGKYSTAEVKAKGGAILRARGGYLVTPEALVYATAGAAYQKIEVAGTCPASWFVCNPALGARGTSKSKDMWGWTLGAGVEYAFAPHWTARLDYTYADYGKMDFVAMQWETGASSGSDAKIEPKSQAVTLGVNYKF